MKSGQLYTGISSDTVTAGFRIYAEPKRKLSSIALIAEPRIAQDPKWLAQQKKRLNKKYDSYWYKTIKGEWTKNDGWPTAADWPKLQAWIVRKKLSPPPQPASRFQRMSPKSSAMSTHSSNSPHSEIIFLQPAFLVCNTISCCNTFHIGVNVFLLVLIRILQKEREIQNRDR